MSQVVLNSDESKALARTIKHIVLRDRIGEIGIFDRKDRFASTNMCLKKKEVEDLNSAFSKLGIKLRTV